MADVARIALILVTEEALRISALRHQLCGGGLL
jgi:hypothetical protein